MTQNSVKLLDKKNQRATDDPQVIQALKKYKEDERKYVPQLATPVQQQQYLLDICHHVRKCQDIFVTGDHKMFAPDLPMESGLTWLMPEDIGSPTSRCYFIDKERRIIDQGIEIRQEDKGNYIKQVVKVGVPGNEDDPTLHRIEYPAKLRSHGFNLNGIRSDSMRDNLRKEFGDSVFIVPLVMTRQRVRIAYHPEGNQNEKIELGIDHILFGRTYDGYIWHQPKLEIEIKAGPEDEAGRRALLEREERRFLSLFTDLRLELSSNPTPGYEHIKSEVTTMGGRRTFNKLQPGDQWWRR